MTTYAKIEEKETYLCSDFGESFAKRYFGEEAINSLPKFIKGKNKGKTKGFIQWIKVISGGWVKEGAYSEMYGASGHVETRVGQVIEAKIIIREWNGEEKTMFTFYKKNEK